MKKILLIIFSNILIFCFLIFVAEVIVWHCENKRLERQKDVYYMQHGTLDFHPEIKLQQDDMKFFPAPENNFGRAPVGLNYKKKPIVIFGCSFAYGFELEEKDIFSSILSEYMQRPVYNRAFIGWGIQHMLKQVSDEEFYEKVPEPEYVIFLSIYDHFRRLYAITFFSGDMLKESFYLRYKVKDDYLIEIRHQNAFYKFIKSLYIVQKFHHFYVNNVIINGDKIERNFDFALKHYEQSIKEMKKHWKNTKYYVLFYDDFNNLDIFKSELEKMGYKTINIRKLTEEDLYAPEYTIIDGHPSAKAWKLLTPLIAEEIEKN